MIVLFEHFVLLQSVVRNLFAVVAYLPVQHLSLAFFFVFPVQIRTMTWTKVVKTNAAVKMKKIFLRKKALDEQWELVYCFLLDLVLQPIQQFDWSLFHLN